MLIVPTPRHKSFMFQRLSVIFFSSCTDVAASPGGLSLTANLAVGSLQKLVLYWGLSTVVKEQVVWEGTGTFRNSGSVRVLLVTSQGDVFSWNKYMGLSHYWGLD